MNDTYKNIQNFAICILLLAGLIFGAYFLAPIIKPVEDSGLDTSAPAMGIRFLLMFLGALLVLGICFATREHEAWEVNAQRIVYMAIGSVMYGVFAWLFNGTTLPIPTLSKVALRPAAVLPVFFGYTFGPVVGFMVGAVGHLIGELFVGNVSPHWTLAHGLIGFFAGLPMLFKDRRQSWDMGSLLTGLGGIIAVAFFLADPGTEITVAPDTEPTKLTLLLGFSVLVGCALAIAVRFAFPNRLQWADAVVWGAAGNLVGLGLAAVGDIWVNSYTTFYAVVGEFIPAAGPNIVAMTILVPLLMVVYAATGQSAET